MFSRRLFSNKIIKSKIKSSHKLLKFYSRAMTEASNGDDDIREISKNPIGPSVEVYPRTFAFGEEDEKSLDELMTNKEQWYGDAIKYWQNVPPTVEGMLQGYQHISNTDAEGSRKFVDKLIKKKLLTCNCHRALDCGGGVGRVSKSFLLKKFKTVDILEQEPKFTAQINEYMGSLKERVENIYTLGMQDFNPDERRYNVIWIQWVIGHLTDSDLISFLARCKNSLVDGGCICIKENVASGEHVFDEEDSSVTRTHEQFVALFKQANMDLVFTQPQKGFPSQLFTVNMYALTYEKS